MENCEQNINMETELNINVRGAQDDPTGTSRMIYGDDNGFTALISIEEAEILLNMHKERKFILGQPDTSEYIL